MSHGVLVDCFAPTIAAAPPLPGRTATATASNTSTATIAFSGGAPLPGVWMFLVVANSTNQNSDGAGGVTVSGSWTEILSGSVDVQFFKRRATSGEPSSYTITYNATGKNDAIAACMVEALNANAINEDVSAVVGNVTCASITPNSANELILLLAGVVMFGTTTPTQPSGFTMLTNIQTGTFGQSPEASISYKSQIVQTLVSPGTFAYTNSPAVIRIGTVGVKP